MTIEPNILSLQSFNKFNNRKFRKVVKSELNLKTTEYTEKKFGQIFKDLEKDIKNKNYHISPYEEFFIIKDAKKNVTRRIVQFQVKDFFLYFYLVFQLQDEIAQNYVNGTYGGFRFSNNALKHKEDELDIYYSDYPTLDKAAFQKAYGEFQSKIKENCDRYKFMVKIDIANFYDNISIGLLEEKLRNHITTRDKSEILSLLFYFLKYWDKKIYAYSPRSVGIPQDVGGEASRMLANFYLQEYDQYIAKKCEEYNIKYLRYADDQIFFANSNKPLKDIVFLASRRLIRLNLNINMGKVLYENTSGYQEKNFCITFSSDIQEMYNQLNNFYKNGVKIVFCRGLKKLINLIAYVKPKEDITYIDISKIKQWVTKDKYMFLHQMNRHDIEKIKIVACKLNIENDISIIICRFISQLFDTKKISDIKSEFSGDESIQKKCKERLDELLNK